MRTKTRSVFVKVATVLLTLPFLALGDAQAQARRNHVDSVTVNGLNVFQDTIGMAQWQNAFGKDGVTRRMDFIECAANHEVDVHFTDRKITLEFFPEDNPGLDPEKLLAEKNDAYRQSPLRARLWIRWEDIPRFRDDLIVDGKAISAQMTFEEFKRRFPLSASRKVGGFPGEEENYPVLLGKSGSVLKDEDLPYEPALWFTFRDGKLLRLSLLRGSAC